VLVLPLLSLDRCIGFLTADHGGEPFELDSSAAELLRTIGALVARSSRAPSRRRNFAALTR